MSTTLSTKNIEAVSSAADVLGHKWSSEIIHSLSNEPMGFCQLQRAIGGVNPRTLSARLDSLIELSVISRKSALDCSGEHYHLEQKGRDLLPAIVAMEQWGQKYS